MKKLSHEPWFAAADKASNSTAKSDDEFRQSFLGVSSPFFCQLCTTQKARHFSASTYSIKAAVTPSPPNLVRNLAQVRVPTAVCEGDHDVITTRWSRSRLKRGIANSTLFMIRNAGHFPWLEQRNAFS